MTETNDINIIQELIRTNFSNDNVFYRKEMVIINSPINQISFCITDRKLHIWFNEMRCVKHVWILLEAIIEKQNLTLLEILHKIEPRFYEHTNMLDYDIIGMAIDIGWSSIRQEMCNFAIECGLDINRQNKLFRQTNAHQASLKGNLEALKWLKENGADLNSCDRYNQTPVYLAESLGHIDCVAFLKD